MNRRAFLADGGRTVAFALAAGAPRTEPPPALEQTQPAGEKVEDRVAAVIQSYDAQGNHRTGTDADQASAEWLASEVRQSGAEASLEPFTLNRLDPQACYLRIGDRRIDGVPLFDAGLTGAEGVRGRLGPLGSDAEIGLAETTPFRVNEPIGIEERNQVAEARHSGHKAVVLLTRGTRPGLFVINAGAFTKPFGPATLQVSSVESEWLNEQAQTGAAAATIVVHAKRTMTRAFNVTSKIAGRNPNLAPKPNLIHASDDALERWAVAAMEEEGLTVNGKAPHGSKARGETGAVQQGVGRFVTLVCGSDVYHNVADRWPEAVDVANLAHYARAFANGALELAQQE